MAQSVGQNATASKVWPFISEVLMVMAGNLCVASTMTGRQAKQSMQKNVKRARL